MTTFISLLKAVVETSFGREPINPSNPILHNVSLQFCVPGFLSWDKDSCHVDLEKELLALVAQAPEGEEARNGISKKRIITKLFIPFYPNSPRSVKI